MLPSTQNILPFVLSDRWIVTVESERRLVKVRHRTRWYAVARRKGHKERRHWCASRDDALEIAEYMRQGFCQMAELEWFQAVWDELGEKQREEVKQRINALEGE